MATVPLPLPRPRHPGRSRSHVPKSRSIGSEPLPYALRLTPTISMPPRGSSLATSPNFDAPIRSPSRLPATDSMSYFPPFETMGSGPSSPAAEPSDEPGPSVRKVEHGHHKGRSLGSFAGLMSFLSPGDSPHRPTPSPLSRPSVLRDEMHRSSSDGDVLQALAKRVTPGKRRVLEPITVSANEVVPDAVLDAKYQRRCTSSDVKVRTTQDDVFEDSIVESMITPSRPRRRPRPHLTLPFLPQWRFPMPSPPVISLSPDIPLSAFAPIENPASNPSSTESSPSKPLTPSTLCVSHRPYEPAEDMEDDLSPTTSYDGSVASGLSRPTTPHDDWGTRRSSPQSGRSVRSFEECLLYPQLERSVSQISSDSKETIRPSKEIINVGSALEGQVTPKAYRWRL